MRILFLGDVVGRSGRDAVVKHLPSLKEKLKPDATIVNGENSAHGVGITEVICKELYAAGTDVITTGNHAWAQREIIPYFDRDPKLLRPLNFPKGTMGNGVYVHQTESGERIAVINAMGRIFMDPIENPFTVMDEVLQSLRLGVQVQAIFVDFHGEATSEKMALAQYLDGRVSAVIGTHTHLPTNDCQIFDAGTGFQSDAGMCGDYNSVIGVKKAVPIHNFVKQTPTERMSPADGEATICGTFIETDARGLCRLIEPVIIGPRLKNHMPSV
jgi:2',3'-cyclic-nucleotide 2'-phosphodiesterase